jgi:hypothetical protein
MIAVTNPSNNTTNHQKIRFLTIGDMMSIFDVSDHTAVKYRKLVADSVGKKTTNITRQDVNDYFKIK